MAIYSYEKNGKTYYRVLVKERSKKHPYSRIQRSKSGIESEAKARREEKNLTRLVIEKLARIESKGITWRELVHRWELYAKSGLSVEDAYSWVRVKDHVKRIFLHAGTWMEKRIRDLNRGDGRYVINSIMDAFLSISSIKKVKGSINKVWTWGVEEGLVYEGAKSPVHGIVVESEKKGFKPILTLEEIRKLLYEAEIREHPWRHVWAVALLTGMRIVELMAVTWDDVDFDNDILRITKSYSPRIKDIKCTKSAEWRNAHISEDLKNVLLEVKRLYPDQELVFPRFSGFIGGGASTILRGFLARIGIEKYVTFHTLRACFATHVLASGVEPTKVMKMGGWADFKTFQIYVRMAGVDVKGTTDNFRVTPNLGVLDNVYSLRG